MAFILSGLLNWLRGLFFAKHLEVTIVGLQASGKTSLVNVLGSNQWSEDVVPTVAFNLRQVRKGNVTMKVWDVAGQPKFRGMWDRYCRGADAIIYVVDAADSLHSRTLRSIVRLPIHFHALHSTPGPAHDSLSFPSTSRPPPAHSPSQPQRVIRSLLTPPRQTKSLPTSTSELHALLALPALASVPLLVLANKNDLPGAIGVDDLIREMRLGEIGGRVVSCYSTSNKTKHNLDIVLAWLTQRAH